MRSSARAATLEHLDPLVGRWEIEATHRLLPGEVIRGRATFEWMPGERVMIWRSDYDHPDIPDSISILTCDEEGSEPADANGDGSASMHYVDQRGITRAFRFSSEAGVFHAWRDWPGFSQRFTYTLSPDGATLSGVAELNQDDTTWVRDLEITYRRRS